MTRTTIGLLTLAMVGCTTGESQFSHQSELGVDARGVALSQDGMRGQVGMSGTTCAVNTRTSAIGSDLDYGAGDEVVQDSTVTGGSEIYLIQSDDGLHLQFSDALASVEPSMAGTFEDGRLFDNGVLGLEGGDTLRWSTGGEARVDGLSSFDVDSAGQAFVADGMLYQVTPEGRTELAAGVDRVAVDEFAGALYAAAEGSSQLQVLELDGTFRASVDVGGEILAMSDMGDRGAAVVVVSHGTTGELVLVDSTGEIAGWVGTPTPAETVHAAGNGSGIAVTVPGAIHFFGVE